MNKQANIQDYDAIIQWSYSLASEWAITNLVPKGVTSSRKFLAYRNAKGKLPVNFPKDPQKYFKRRNSWKSWEDFLGYPNKELYQKEFCSYDEARKIIIDSGIRNSVEFRNWKKRPSNVPARPEYHYSEWISWKDFLGEKYWIPKVKRNAKLSKDQVRIIKHQLSLGVSGATLAKFFQVSEMQISRIKHGENWEEI